MENKSIREWADEAAELMSQVIDVDKEIIRRIYTAGAAAGVCHMVNLVLDWAVDDRIPTQAHSRLLDLIERDRKESEAKK